MHPLNLRIPAALLTRLRREAAESGLTLSAVARLALDRGIDLVAARTVNGGAP